MLITPQYVPCIQTYPIIVIRNTITFTQYEEPTNPHDKYRQHIIHIERTQTPQHQHDHLRNKSNTTHIDREDSNHKIQGLFNRVQGLDRLLKTEIIDKYNKSKSQQPFQRTPQDKQLNHSSNRQEISQGEAFQRQNLNHHSQSQDDSNFIQRSRIHSAIVPSTPNQQLLTQVKQKHQSNTSNLEDETTTIQKKIGHMRKQSSQRTLYYNNTYYVGEVDVDDQKHGIGTLYDQNRAIIYSGIWNNNKYEVRGKLYFHREQQFSRLKIDNFEDFRTVQQNKVSYTGEFQEGQMTGLGQMLFGNEDDKRFIYHGRFYQGVFDGPGTVLEVFGGKNKIKAVWRDGLCDTQQQIN